jgi:hypothetical protein
MLFKKAETNICCAVSMNIFIHSFKNIHLPIQKNHSKETCNYLPTPGGNGRAIHVVLELFDYPILGSCLHEPKCPEYLNLM